MPAPKNPAKTVMGMGLLLFGLGVLRAQVHDSKPSNIKGIAERLNNMMIANFRVTELLLDHQENSEMIVNLL